VNLRIAFAAFAFGLIETAYFGWNVLPQSGAEVVCDGITALLSAMSVIWRRQS